MNDLADLAELHKRLTPVLSAMDLNHEGIRYFFPERHYVPFRTFMQNDSTIKNAYGEPVVNEDGIYHSEKELKTGIKSRQYTIFQYPELEIADTE